MMTRHEEVRQTLWNTVRVVREDDLQVENSAGWSILSVLEHLAVVEQHIARAMARELESKNFRDIPVHPSLAEAVVDRSRKVAAPEALSPKGLVRTLDQAKETLQASTQLLDKTYLSVASDEELDQLGFRHPLFGVLSIRQWYDFIALHELRHLAQIEEMLKIRNEAKGWE